MTSFDPPTSPDSFGARFSSDDLYQSVYVSKAAPDHGPDTLADILRVARRKNHEAGITGLLVYFDGRFLQYLEGPGLAVRGTLALIKEDARHHDMEILVEQRSNRRLFQKWDMGCVEVGTDAWLRLVRADWPTMRPLGRNNPSGIAVLQELAANPVAEHDLPGVLTKMRRANALAAGDADAADDETTDPASARDVSLLGALGRFQLLGLVLFGVALLAVVLYQVFS